MPPSDRASLSYRDSGVDIDAGDRLVERIRPLAEATARPEVLTGLGGFGALFELPPGRWQHPVLVSGTDGVGTKLLLATRLDRHDTIGIDLVAMCVNDIVTSGAEPLFFLDYFATSRLEAAQAEAVVAGISKGCIEAGCALVGGETAEMPGLYPAGEYDLAGFAVGVVEKDAIVRRERVRAGDTVIGLASDGLHSNGYSLVRRVLEVSGADLAAPLDGTPLGEVLLTPTRLYVRAVLACLAAVPVAAACHVTGGGITGNLPRVLPDGLGARIDTGSWQWPAVFDWVRETGNVARPEMYRTFNCGIGMILVTAPADAGAALDALAAAGETAAVIGEVTDTPGVRLEGPRA